MNALGNYLRTMPLIVVFGFAAATVVAQDGRPTAEPATPATPQGEAADAVEPLDDQAPDAEAVVPIVLNPDGRRPDRVWELGRIWFPGA